MNGYKQIDVISLGVGVQSSTVKEMAEQRLITPMPVAAVMADTQIEPAAVYAWLEHMKRRSREIPIRVVTRGDLGADGLELKVSKKSGRVYQKNLIPLFIRNPDDRRGILVRKCTAEYKVRMIVKECRAIVGADAMKAWRRAHKDHLAAWNAYEEAKRLARAAKMLPPRMPPAASEGWKAMQADALVVSWIGISTDEADRMKPSRDPWIRTRHPLIELGMSRQDCIDFMVKTGAGEPPRSACIICPYHNDHEWQRMKAQAPAEFQWAVEWERKAQAATKQDEAARFVEVYLHDSMQNLDTIDFDKRIAEAEAKGKHPAQVDAFSGECEGMCGL